jgi:hypothetical protein
VTTIHGALFGTFLFSHEICEGHLPGSRCLDLNGHHSKPIDSAIAPRARLTQHSSLMSLFSKKFAHSRSRSVATNEFAISGNPTAHELRQCRLHMATHAFLISEPSTQQQRLLASLARLYTGILHSERQSKSDKLLISVSVQLIY